MDRVIGSHLAREAQRVLPDIRNRIAGIRRRIETAAENSGHDPMAVRLIVVTKKSPPAVALAAHLAGADGLGENRADELAEKYDALADELGEAQPNWHFVGHLQRNKARLVIGRATCIQSVDSVALTADLGRRSRDAGFSPPEILVEVNVAAESQKHGISPAELIPFVDQLIEIGMPPRGLMCMAPRGSSEAEARTVFARLALLRHEVSERFPHLELPDLSMGMTDDFECAVAEGATMIRIGRAITAGVV